MGRLPSLTPRNPNQGPQVGDHKFSTPCGVIKHSDQQCGDDLVKCRHVDGLLTICTTLFGCFVEVQDRCIFAHVWGKWSASNCNLLQSIFLAPDFQTVVLGWRHTYLCNLLRNLLWIMRLAVVQSMSYKYANSAICYLDAEFSGLKCRV